MYLWNLKQRRISTHIQCSHSTKLPNFLTLGFLLYRYPGAGHFIAVLRMRFYYRSGYEPIQIPVDTRTWWPFHCQSLQNCSEGCWLWRPCPLCSVSSALEPSVPLSLLPWSHSPQVASSVKSFYILFILSFAQDSEVWILLSCCSEQEAQAFMVVDVVHLWFFIRHPKSFSLIFSFSHIPFFQILKSELH